MKACYLRMRITVKNASRSVRPREPVFTFIIALIFISICSPYFARAGAAGSAVANVRIGVLGLFHPKELTISAFSGDALVLHAGGESIVLERSSGVNAAIVRLDGTNLVLQAGNRIVHISVLTVRGRKNDTAEFVLGIPGKIARHYRGALEIRQSSGSLLAEVTMDRETAVASIVAAESSVDMPI